MENFIHMKSLFLGVQHLQYFHFDSTAMLFTYPGYILNMTGVCLTNYYTVDIQTNFSQENKILWLFPDHNFSPWLFQVFQVSGNPDIIIHGCIHGLHTGLLQAVNIENTSICIYMNGAINYLRLCAICSLICDYVHTLWIIYNLIHGTIIDKSVGFVYHHPHWKG